MGLGMCDFLRDNDIHYYGLISPLFIFFLPLSKQIPTLVLGASGCGKTHMLVECVKLLMLFAPEMHILICTHTNAAANIFVERLHMECKGEQDTREIVGNESLTEAGRLADSESNFTGSSLRSLSEMAKVINLHKSSGGFTGFEVM